MATYLLTWNPAKWGWDELNEDIETVNHQGYGLFTWSCGVTRKIIPGDRVFLIKLGRKEPRGIMASGWVASDVFEGEHYDEVAARNGRTALFIDVYFDTILDPESSIFPSRFLDIGVYKKMNWRPQASGTTIPNDVAAQLEKDWANLIGQVFPVPDIDFAEEVSTKITYIEGATKKVTVNAYERSQQARSVCIKYYGFNCSVCSFNFEEIYGAIGADFIHVHHLKPISQIGQDYELNPIEDLRPVCPNCHAMLHKRDPAFSIQELQTMMIQNIDQEE